MIIPKQQYEEQQKKQVDSKLTAAINNLVEFLRKDNTDVTDAINKLANVEHPAPEVNVTTNQTDVIQAIETMDMNVTTAVQNQRPLKWNFDFIRNEDGFIQSVIATAITE